MHAELRNLGLDTSIISTCGDVIIGMTLDGVITSWNRAAEILYGYTADEAIGRPVEFMVPDDRKGGVRDVREKILRGERVVRYETVVVAKDGRNIDVSITSSPILDESGRVIGSSIIARDITERKRAEEALRESEGKFRVLADTSTAAIYVHQDENIVYVNNTAEKVTGYSKDELLKMKFWDIFHPDHRDIVRERGLARQRGESMSSPYEAKFLTKGGETRWFEVSAGRIMYRGKPAVVTTFFDITERKRAEEALKDAKARAEVYLDLMLHDITNMNHALLGYLELMEGMQGPGNIDKTLIDNSIDIVARSSRIIGDVKKLTRLRDGNISPKDVDVCEILSMVISRHSHGTNGHVTINYVPGESCIVRADDLLDDVFDNLVDNAIRHSKGPVTIDITVDRTTREGHRYCRIAVADHGRGIPPELKRKILMTIEEIGAGEKIGRRGLGLCMVRTLVDHYQGRVWIEDRVPSDYTKGARFVVMLPAIKK